MAVNTSTSPYYDDYSEGKNFHRVLFKPGVAVQGRELTQSQTILQNQVKRVGDYLFTDGSKVTGHNPIVNLDARTIRLNTKNAQGQSIDVTTLLNKYVVGTQSDIIGYVEFVFEKDTPNIGDAPAVVISLKRFNTTNNGIFSQREILSFYTDYTDALNKVTPNTTAVVDNDIVKNAVSSSTVYSKTITIASPTSLIEVGDLLVHPQISTAIYVTKIVSSILIEISAPTGVVIGNENIQYVKKGTCPTSIVTQDVAYFYKNGFMVRSGNQKIVPDKNTAFPSKLVSLIVSEQIITSADDETLLDPAIGSSNYFAPGADRLQINLSIASFDLNINDKADTTLDHIPLIKFNQGQIDFVTDPATGILQGQLAERTYDESGNYVVDPFIITPVSTVDEDTNLVFNASSGKAYVGGYPVSTVGSTQLYTPKPTNTDTKTGLNITTSQGNYIRITDVEKQLPKVDQLEQGDIFLELHNVTNPGSTGQPDTALTKVGTLVYKNIEYDSSLGQGTQFRMFYHNYSTVKEVPATWDAWSTKYSIPASEGQYISTIFYDSATAATLLGNYGPASTPCYALYREPDVDGVAYWWNQWKKVDGGDIAKTKQKFAEYLLAQITSADYARMISSTKTYSAVSNGSPFIDGLLDVNKIKSIIGVANDQTTYLHPSAGYTTPFFYANVAPTGIDSVTGDIVIYDPRASDSLIFPISKSYVKTINNIRTTYTKVIKNAIFSGGVYTKKLSLPETYALGDGAVFASTARTNFIVLVKSGATASVPLGIFNFETGSVTISADSSTATLDLGDNTFTGIADIEYTIQSDNLPIRTKTLVKDASQAVNVATADSNYSLKISDVSITGVYKLGTNNVAFKGPWSKTASYDYNQFVLQDGKLYKAITPTSNVAVTYANAWSSVNSLNPMTWVLSSGQTDGWYDHGFVKYIGPTSDIPGNVLVTYDYFTHSGEGPCTVNSYPASYYRQIGGYKSTIDSNYYNLRDCLDFRPRRVDGSSVLTFDAAVFPTSTINTDADVTYYLGRIDKLYISKESRNFDNPYDKFYFESGAETNSPTTNNILEDKNKLAIATFLIPPFPKNSTEVVIQYENNRRFTMGDISKIQESTVLLDKQIKAHSVEIAALKSIVTNDNGDILLKSGVFIENFTDFNKGDIGNGYFCASYDTKQGTCHPLFSGYNLDLDLVSVNGVAISRDIITAKYTEEIFASQLDGNSLVNPNPGAINDGRGRATLSASNSRKTNLIQTGFSILTTLAIGWGLYSLYSKASLIYQAFTGQGILSGISTAGYAFIDGASLPITTIGDYASLAFKTAYDAVSGTVSSIFGGGSVATPVVTQSIGVVVTPVLESEGTVIVTAAVPEIVSTGVVSTEVSTAGLIGTGTTDLATVTTASSVVAPAAASPLVPEVCTVTSAAGPVAADAVVTDTALTAGESTVMSTVIDAAPYVMAAVIITDIIKGNNPLETISNTLNGIGDTATSLVNGAGDFVQDTWNKLTDW